LQLPVSVQPKGSEMISDLRINRLPDWIRPPLLVQYRSYPCKDQLFCQNGGLIGKITAFESIASDGKCPTMAGTLTD
jgi:hypothetical protein